MSPSLKDFALQMLRSNPNFENNPMAQNAIQAIENGEALTAGNMVTQAAAANNIYNVSRPGVQVRKIGCSNTVSVRNNGTTNIILPAKSARLSIKRIA